MRLRLISELFDKSVSIEWEHRWSKNGEGEWSGSFSVGDNEYIIQMDGYEDIWEVAFALNDSDGYSHEITGAGSANIVFATVLRGLREWLKVVEPTSFSFSADGPSRVKLYKRMLDLLPDEYSVDSEYRYGSNYAQFNIKRVEAHASGAADSLPMYQPKVHDYDPPDSMELELELGSRRQQLENFDFFNGDENPFLTNPL